MLCNVGDVIHRFVAREEFGTVKRRYALESLFLMHAMGSEAFSFWGSRELNTTTTIENVQRYATGLELVEFGRQQRLGLFVVLRLFESDGIPHYRNKCLRAVPEGVRSTQELAWKSASSVPTGMFDFTSIQRR